MGLRQRLAGLFRRKPKSGSSRISTNDSSSMEFAVIGLGTFGQPLALRLSELGFTVLGIDSSAAAVQAVADDLSTSLVLDATDEAALRQADIESYATAIVAIGGDHFEAAALTTIALAKIGIPHIVAVVNTARQAEILEAIGATRILSPVRESALALADELADPGSGETWAFSPRHQVAMIDVPESLVGRPADSLQQMGVTVLAVRRGEEAGRLADPTAVLGAGHTLLVLGEAQAILALRRLD